MQIYSINDNYGSKRVHARQVTNHLVSVHLFHQVRVFLQNDLSLHFKSWGQLSAVDAEIHWENAEFLQLEDKKRSNITIPTQP